MQYAGQQKDFLITLLLCIFVGYLGVHRFYSGHIGIGIVQLLTIGGCGIWTLIDLITIITGSYRDSAGLPLRRQ
jgi:TM2 domain-containing membrane protein YozV